MCVLMYTLLVFFLHSYVCVFYVRLLLCVVAAVATVTQIMRSLVCVWQQNVCQTIRANIYEHNYTQRERGPAV